MRRILHAALLLVFLAPSAELQFGATIAAQQPQPAPRADWGKWERLMPQPRATSTGPISPDGRWLAYGINRSNGRNELRVIGLPDLPAKAGSYAAKETAGRETSDVKVFTAAFGEQPAFSADSRWVAYAIGQSETEQERLRKQKKPIQRKLGVLDLSAMDRGVKAGLSAVAPSAEAGAATRTFDAVESFVFDNAGTHLAFRHYPPELEKRDDPPTPGGTTPAGDAADEVPLGATLLVLDLGTGGTMTFGNVTEYAWQPGSRDQQGSREQGAGSGAVSANQASGSRPISGTRNQEAGSRAVSGDRHQEAELLAMIVRPLHGAGHGVHLYDPRSGVVRVLDSGEAAYAGLSWRKDADDLAVFRAKTDARREGEAQVLLVWKALASGGDVSRRAASGGDVPEGTSLRTPAKTLDATGVLPAGTRVVDWAKPAWSSDGRTVFIGVADWQEKPPEPAKRPTDGAGKPTDGGADLSAAADASAFAEATADRPTSTAMTGREATRLGGGWSADTQVGPEDEEPASVDVWHPRDVDVMPKQKINARRDRRRSHMHAWHVDTGRLVPLAKSFSEDVHPIARAGVPSTPLGAGNAGPYDKRGAAWLADRAPYEMARSIGRIGADLYLVDLETGDRRRVRARINERSVQASPGGRYLLFFDADHYWSVDVASGAVTNLTRAIPSPFVNRESDATTPQKPPYGAAGWLRDDSAVLLYDKYDVWEVRPDGSKPVRLTSGAAEEFDHRYVALDRDADGIDRTKPIYFRIQGHWSKRSGYAVLRAGAAAAERIVWQDKDLDGLARAKHADVYAYVAQGVDDSPDYFVADASLTVPKAVTATNPFQGDYAWGRSEIIEYKSDRGERLQGALLYPAGYVPGKPYPMIVYMYEKLSDDVHLYTPLTDRQYYNVSVFTSLGYFVLKPDIVFRPREPGLSVVECVLPAVKRVVQTGVVDPKRVGIVGHSWGGFDTAFLATHTDTFAAAVAGAAITNLVSNYGNHHWSQGIAETDHIETGQQRMVVPLYDDLPAYVRNSALFGVGTMKTPLLLATGDSDGTVHWHQSVELYNAARRAGKQVTMVVYGGEDHGLRKKANQQDYQRRILDWFGHYLQGQPAAPWIENGVSFLENERAKRSSRTVQRRSTTEP